MTRTYVLEGPFGLPPKRFGVVVREYQTGRWLGPKGTPVVVVSTGVEPNAPHVFPCVPCPPPWGEVSRVELTLSAEAPEGWYAWGLHELDDQGRPLAVGGRGVRLTHGMLYHSPDGSRDTEGRPTAVAPTTFVLQPAPRFFAVGDAPP